MKINDNYKNSLAFAQNGSIITDAIYKKLLENCFSVLIGKEEVYSINSLYNSKPDVIKGFYAALLAVSAEFARNNLNREEILQFLTSDCSFTQQRAKIYVEFFENDRRGLEIALLNIGNCLPHVTDVKWKIDYIVKVR
ncbi:hypothetical protein NQ314_014385 [Rhamnusium bicolor]|uniref:COMM domain-containing protein 3 n=1 Tax=Rhamnusium bicolor TaxID=1586634 RepID=A0AAV8X2Z6_9CUCU|nr:hypothetical protein NQ314_014385 [Rhamnusium bicolor]